MESLNPYDFHQDFSLLTLPSVFQDLPPSFLDDKTKKISSQIFEGDFPYPHTLQLQDSEEEEPLFNKEPSPLQRAIENGDVDMVHILLSAGCDINTFTHEDLSFVSLAIALGYYDIALLLLEKGKLDTEKLKDSFIHPLTLCRPSLRNKEPRLEKIYQKLIQMGVKPSDPNKVFYSKILGHVWSLKGGFKSHFRAPFSYNGSHPEVMLPFLLQATKRYAEELEKNKKIKDSKKVVDLNQDERRDFNFQDLPFHLFIPYLEKATQALEQTEQDVQKWNIPDIAQKICKGQTVVLPFQWSGHVMSLIFTKVGNDYFLMTCNKGYGNLNDRSLEVKIMPKPKLEEVTKCLKKLYFYSTDKFYAANYINNDICSDLNLHHFTGSAFKMQQSGNCSWESLKLSFVALIWMNFYQEKLKQEGGKSQSFFTASDATRKLYLKEAQQALIQAKEFYKEWWSFTRAFSLEMYLENLKPHEIDHRTLYQIHKKIQEKQHFFAYQRELKKRVHQLFKDKNISLDTLYFQGQLEEVITQNLSSKVFELLLSQGADCNALTSEGNLDLLALAAKYGRMEIIDAILKHQGKSLKALPKATLKELLQVAVGSHQHQVAEILVKSLCIQSPT